MSEIDWPALLALEGQATAGPWWEDMGEAGTSVQSKHRTIAADMTNADAGFIVSAREAVPALVAMVRGLAGALEASSVDHGQGPCWCSTESASGRYLAGMDNHQHWSGCSTARAALATIPAALRAGVGDE